MKEIYLLCNAHLDPVWQWQRSEGIAEALSTFRVAAAFCEEYNGFVFNHNESLLYEWVEQYEPALFERIQKLVREGRWKIMGGWYLQPDCTMPSGESILRQIEVGNGYFMEKFGVKPVTGVNFDPFGHSRGLVQILAKRGYTGYVFMRPNGIIPEHDFLWRGYDGSEIIGHNIIGGYASNSGYIMRNLEAVMNDGKDGIEMMCWGIGDHGGGPSKRDLDAIEAFAKAHPEVKLTHAWCEKYLDTLDRTSLRVVEQSMVHCMVGCYTSMCRIKKTHRALENELSLCEKMLAVSGIDYDRALLRDAEKDLLFCEFHDILPGSAIKAAEDDALRQMSHGREIVARLCDRAFFRLCDGQKPGIPGEIPVLVFNPHPYTVTTDVEVEYMLEDQNWNENEYTVAVVRDADGRYLPTQHIKEAGSINLDWRKRIVFTASLAPMSITRFDCELKKVQGISSRPIEACMELENHFVFENERMQVSINKETGLLDRYAVDGRDYLNKGGMKIIAYRDNEDPWGMTVDGFYDVLGEFSLLGDADANRFNGYPEETLPNVRVIDNGDVDLRVQAIFGWRHSYAVITYIIPKHGTVIDVRIKMLSNDPNVLYKLSFDTTLNGSRFIGQQMFGKEELLQNEKEVVFQKWCGLYCDDTNFVVCNNGTYGGSAADGRLNLTLLRTPVYLAHPIGHRPLTEHGRSHDHIDIGEREFSYRLSAGEKHPDTLAELYNQKPYALSFFPSGDGEKKNTEIRLDNEDILMTAVKRTDDGRLLVRMLNNREYEQTAILSVFGKDYAETFTPFELKEIVANVK